jgi:type IX secretion system PorP/SprF family membrane protein
MWMMFAAKAQDPSFAQFFSSPLNVNPALTGNIYGKWRVISNFRSQWVGPGDPYSTGTLSMDSKIFQNAASNYVDEMTRIGIGGMMMYDQSLAGGLKSNYASFNFSGNIRLASSPGPDVNGLRIRHLSKMGDETAEHRLGLGIGITYGQRKIDVSKLTFEEQFTGNGFDTNLPTGETALSSMKPFISANAGLIYNYSNGLTDIDIGVAAFHVNKPMQTFLQDENQFLARRYVGHANLETFLTDDLVLNTNGIYQYQQGASYFSIGGALGYYLPGGGETIKMLNAGLWYWSESAVIPYIGFRYENLQVGLTYDLLLSELKQSSKKFKTFELCLVFRGGSNEGDKSVIPSPWK